MIHVKVSSFFPQNTFCWNWIFSSSHKTWLKFCIRESLINFHFVTFCSPSSSSAYTSSSYYKCYCPWSWFGHLPSLLVGLCLQFMRSWPATPFWAPHWTRCIAASLHQSTVTRMKKSNKSNLKLYVVQLNGEWEERFNLEAINQVRRN